MSSILNDERDLQGVGPLVTPKVPLRFYPDKETVIPFDANLGCGACIKGGYVYCVNGPEGSNNLGQCCQSVAQCSFATNPAWTCSNIYSNPVLSLSVCPYRNQSCGNQTSFNYTG